VNENDKFKTVCITVITECTNIDDSLHKPCNISWL